MNKDVPKINGYQLSKQWFDFSFENPEKIRPIHSAIYFFAIEQCNRLGWVAKFGLPASIVMAAIGVKHHSTYSKALDDLVEWGFVIMVQKSKNQYTANIIALSKNSIATSKALSIAISTAHSGASDGQVQCIKTIKPKTIKPKTIIPQGDNGLPIDYRKWTSEEFKKDVWRYKDKYTVEELKNFYVYWTALTPQGKMGFTKQKTWSTGARISNAKRGGFLESKKTASQTKSESDSEKYAGWFKKDEAEESTKT